jgi:transcription antitermination factor NusG
MQPEADFVIPTSPSMHWYVIRAKANRERVVHEQLRDQGLEVFFPSVRVHPVNPRSARERAYFPGYLFVHADLETTAIARLRWLPAAVGLLEFGGEPAVLPDLLITQLRRNIAAIRAAGGLLFTDLQAGDPVRITSGPFAGHEAIFDLRLKGSERVRVLLDFLRRRVPIELDAGQIRKVKQSQERAAGAARERRS